jgi:WXG100 family type VII secretion target
VIIDYKSAELQQAASDVASRVSKLISAVDHLTAQVARARASWISTEASESYQNLQKTWDNNEQQVRSALSKFGTAVGLSGERMDDTEHHNTNMLI